MSATSEETLSINGIFGNDGRFHQKYGDSYEVRHSQVALAAFVDHCINAKTHFIGEAPCGTGKSFGYLIPAILKCHNDKINGIADDGLYEDNDNDSDDAGASKRRTRVVVATANITLQEQLVKKDLPALKELLSDVDLSYCLVKGRSNFLCHDKHADAQLNLVNEMSEESDKDAVRRLIQWGKDTQTGDRSQTGFNVPEQIWEKFTVGDGDCKARGCEYYDKCFTRMNRRQAANSDIIVANYNIILIDLELKSQLGRGILPPYKYVIFDEAHKLEEVARDYFGKEFSNYSIRRITGALNDLVKEWRKEYPNRNAIPDQEWDRIESASNLVPELTTANQFFFADVKSYWERKQPNYAYTPLGENIADHKDLLAKLERAKSSISTYAFRMVRVHGEHHKDSIRFLSRLNEVETMIENLTSIINQSEKDYCYWVEVSKNRTSESVKLIMRPISVAGHLKRVVWDRLHSGIMVSATLAEGGDLKAAEVATPELMESALRDRFGFGMKSVGLPIETKKFVCESPFDFKSNCALIIPTAFPEPTPKNTDAHRRAFLEGTQEAILAAGGRAMVLFTSHAHLKAFYEGAHKLKNAGIKIYAQGLSAENRSELGDLFKNDEKSVLLGTSSYWEGVDVPGNSLMLLVIDKLPFPNFQQDPILAALKDRDSDSFWQEEYIPRMTIKFKQGIGRLIRTKKDMGLLVIGDNRCYPGPGAKNYAAKVFSAIPPMPISTDMSSAKMFFDHLRNQGIIND